MRDAANAIETFTLVLACEINSYLQSLTFVDYVSSAVYFNLYGEASSPLNRDNNMMLHLNYSCTNFSSSVDGDFGWNVDYQCYQKYCKSYFDIGEFFVKGLTKCAITCSPGYGLVSLNARVIESAFRIDYSCCTSNILHRGIFWNNSASQGSVNNRIYATLYTFIISLTASFFVGSAHRSFK